MIELFKLIWCGLVGLFRSRASLEIEILAFRHQLNILRRKSPKRPTFGIIDRMAFAGLYGLAPGVLSAIAIVKPETVIRFCLFGYGHSLIECNADPAALPPNDVTLVIAVPDDKIECSGNADLAFDLEIRTANGHVAD